MVVVYRENNILDQEVILNNIRVVETNFLNCIVHINGVNFHYENKIFIFPFFKEKVFSNSEVISYFSNLKISKDIDQYKFEIFYNFVDQTFCLKLIKYFITFSLNEVVVETSLCESKNLQKLIEYEIPKLIETVFGKQFVNKAYYNRMNLYYEKIYKQL
jgi:hypothetical protein